MHKLHNSNTRFRKQIIDWFENNTTKINIKQLHKPAGLNKYAYFSSWQLQG